MCWILDLGSWIFCFGICAYIHTYIHASWILDLLCWILFVLFHWVYECFCFCSLFGSSETTVLLFNNVLGHRLNGVWAFVFAAMPGLLASKTRVAFRKKFAALIKPDEDADPDAKKDSMIKRPAGAIKRPAGASIDAGNEPTKKRPATGACTAIVPVDDPDAANKDRNKWAFLMRNQDALDPRVRQMLEKANQTETATLVNNAVRRGKTGKWEFNIDNPTMIEKLEKFEERYSDLFEQGQPYEIAEQMWGGREKLNKALHDGIATKVDHSGKMFYQVGRIPRWDEVRCAFVSWGEGRCSDLWPRSN